MCLDTSQSSDHLSPPLYDDHEDDDLEIIEKMHFNHDDTDVFSQEPEESENDDAVNRHHLDSSSTVDPNETGNDVDCRTWCSLVDETKYVAAPPEVMGDIAGGGQEESVHGENKSLILTLVKQVKPGMDLSKVVLPTFILEPRYVAAVFTRP